MISIKINNKKDYNDVLEYLAMQMPQAQYHFKKNNEIQFQCYGIFAKIEKYMNENSIKFNSKIINEDDKIKITVKNKISRLIFDKNIYYDKFVDNLLNSNFSILDSYRSAFKDVDKIRAANLLQKTEVWKKYFKKLETKQGKTKSEKEKIRLYSQFKQQFILCPFDAYIYYVEDVEEGSTIANILGADTNSIILVLSFLYRFMQELKRDYFMNRIKNKIIEEIEQIQLTSRYNFKILGKFENTKHFLKKNDIIIEDIISENIDEDY